MTGQDMTKSVIVVLMLPTRVLFNFIESLKCKTKKLPNGHFRKMSKFVT
jgi:hypothetical protein